MKNSQAGNILRFLSGRSNDEINNLSPVSIYYSNSKVHYPSLDGLRGVAVLSVILYHVLHFRPGWMGVDLFFVLSGFLITSILLDTKNSPAYFKNFYIKRLLRIFPLYYGTLLLFFLPFLLKHSYTIVSEALPYFGYVQNISFTIARSWPVDSLSSLNHFWSLAIEEQFYIFFPLLIYFVKDRMLPFICGALVILAIACRCWFYFTTKNDVACYTFTFCRMDGLLIGALANMYARKYNRVRLGYFMAVLLLAIVVSCINMDFTNPLYLTFGFTINALLFAFILLLSLSPNTYIAKIMYSPVLRHLGKYSYGLYVFHHIFFILINYAITTRFKESGTMQNLIPVITLAATYITALLSFHLFETPILRLKKKFVSV
jgi:peptidoglycan/LPS O-acetylase OafA/YrhL